MQITLNRREAVKLMTLCTTIESYATDTDISSEYQTIHDKIKDAVDKWDEKHRTDCPWSGGNRWHTGR